MRDVPIPEPGQGEVLVRTTASVLNFNEVDGCYGRYRTFNPSLPFTLGMECVGTVVGCGTGAESWLGKRVTMNGRGATGAHADYCVGPAAMIFEAPAQLDDEEAAAFFFPFHLSYLGLHERGRLKAGEVVVVHAAAGGIGSAAVQLASAAGARVIATVGDDEKSECVSRLGADRVINYRTTDFSSVVLDETNGRGADVVFDGVGGDVMRQSLECLGRGGRYLVVGFSGGVDAQDVPMVTPRTICFGNFDIAGVVLAYADLPTGGVTLPSTGVRFNPPTVADGQRVQAALLDLLDGGKIHPVVGASFEYSALPHALESMETRRTKGRIVLGR